LKAPEKLGQLVLLLHESSTQVVDVPSAQTVQESVELTGYVADAHVLAAAIDAGVDYFVTLDKQHFLDNEQLKSAVSFPVGTPGDFLAWFRSRLIE
jgi:predicted nucleic acid-binding protein